tara:strand:+ start:2167 stop:3993 length:1827 start_codon:yes stop_codon:yes gene_type:complete
MGSSAKVFETVSNHFLQRRANERQRKHEMEMLDKQLQNAQDVAKVKAGLTGPKYSLGWATPNAAGGAMMTSLGLAGDPTDSSLYKDEKDRQLEMRKALNILATKSESEISSLIAGKDPSNINHAAYNQVKQIFDLYSSTALKENRSQTTGDLVSWQSLMDLDAFDNAALRAEFIDPIHMRRMGTTLAASTPEDILANANLYGKGANYSKGELNSHSNFAGGILSMGDAFIMNDATEKRIVASLDAEQNHLLNDLGTYYQIMNSSLNNSNYKRIGNSNIVSYTNRTTSEKKLIPEMQQMNEALMNGTETSYEILKAIFGYRDRKGKIVDGIGYESTNLIYKIDTVFEGLFDLQTDIGKRFGSQASKLTKYNSKLFSRARGAYGEDDEGFFTGAKSIAGGEVIKDKEYDGMTIEEAFSYDFTKPVSKSNKLEQIARVKALQIHLAFQVAIAEQGFEGGKAVSDADFDRAWEEIGAGGGGFFGAQPLEDLKAKMIAVIGRFGRGMAYTDAYLKMGDGKRQQGALLSEEILRSYWKNKVSNIATQTGEPNDFGWWASRNVFFRKVTPDILWHKDDIDENATYQTYKSSKKTLFKDSDNTDWNSEVGKQGVSS